MVEHGVVSLFGLWGRSAADRQAEEKLALMLVIDKVLHSTVAGRGP